VSTFAVVSSSHYLCRVAEGEALPSLDARLEAVVRERYRRIDRFIALAVVGAGECAARAELAPGCALYLASGVGPVGRNTQVQEQLCRDRQMPKPFNFVNTLGSAAGHYVAKNLGLSGQNLFISTRGDAFQTALKVAAADLELGLVPQALVGAVEECSFPLDVHRRRQGLAPDASIAEGTHWVLLENVDGKPRGATLTLERHATVADLARRVKEPDAQKIQWIFSLGTDPARAALWAEALAIAKPFRPPIPFHDSRDASLLTGWRPKYPGERLALVTSLGRSGALVIEVGG
jgi:hypothetical protein